MEIIYLTQITETLKTSFPEQWEKKYNFDSFEINEATDNAILAFTRSLSDLNNKIFDHLNASILVGEYVLGNFDSLLEKINNNLVSISFTPKNEIAQEVIEEHLNNNFIRCIQIALSIYRKLYLLVKDKYLVDNRVIMFNNDSIIDDYHTNNSLNENSNNNLRFFVANYFVAATDHFLSTASEQYTELYNIVKQKSISGNKFSSVLIQKTNFLINKLILRKLHSGKTPLFKLDDDKVELVEPQRHFASEINKKWYDYIRTHYELSNNWESKIRVEYDKDKFKPIEECTYLELHRRIKYYKDIDKDLNNLRQVRAEIERRYNEIKQSNKFLPIDIYAHTINYIYALNNELSLCIDLLCKKDDSVTLAEIDSLYKKIVAIETSSGIKNFFPQVKYLQYLTKELKDVFNERKALKFVEPSRNLINKCKEIIKLYSNNIKWAEKNLNYLYQLPYNECLTSVESQYLERIFIASSFLLPISVDRYVDDFNNYESTVNSYTTSVEIIENLQNDIKEIEELKKGIGKEQTRAIEVIGLFSAIVTFVVGSLPSFQYVKTVCDALLFMLALSSSLSLFMMVLTSLFRGIVYVKENKKLIIIVLSLTSVSWITLLAYPTLVKCKSSEKTSESDTSQLQSHKNSINVQNTITLSNKQPINKTTKPPSTKSDTCRPKDCPPCPDCSKISNTSK